MSEGAKLQHVSAVAAGDQLASEVISQTGMLGSERNRLYSFCIVLVIALSILSLKLVAVAEKGANNYKVAWVKMYPNGTWDVELHDNLQPHTVLQNTVDSILSEWVERRFSERRETIRTDFGYVSLFMSEKLQSSFIGVDQFNAPSVAARILECGGCKQVKYKVGPIDHFDVDPTYFTGDKSEIYRTNIFADRFTTNSAGVLETTEKRIVRVQWRLLKPSEIQSKTQKKGGLEWLRNNPVGIEIIDYQELDDPSDK